MKNRIYTLTALLSFIAAISWAQVTRTINYQANITQNGVPFTQSSNTVRVIIHPQGAPGNIKYEEWHYNVPITNGLLNITVGAGTVIPGIGRFADLGVIPWQNNYQIRIQINPSSPQYIQVPSTLLNPSLLSLQAVSTMQLSNSGNDMTTTNTGNFGIGLVTTPTQRLDVNGAIRIGDITAPAVDGTIRFTLSSGFEGFRGGVWVGLDNSGGGSSPWTTNGANIYNSNSGNVGIGAISPVAKLEVNGPVKIGGFGQGNYPQAAGMMRFQSGIFEGYNGQAWVTFGAGAAPTLSVNGNLLSISGGNTVTLPSLSGPWVELNNNMYNQNTGKIMIGTINPVRPEKFQFIDDVTGAYQNSAKFIRYNPYGSTLSVIDSGISGSPVSNRALSAQSIYGAALYGESTTGYGLQARGGGSFYPAALIEANSASGATALVVSNTSGANAPQINVEEITGGNYGRINFSNFGTANSSTWTLAGLNTSTPANDRLNLFHSAAGDVLSVTGDGKTLIKGATAFNNSFGTTGQVLQSNGNNAAPTWVTPVVAPSIYNNMIKTFIPGVGTGTPYAVMSTNASVPIPELNANVSLQSAGKGLIDIQLNVSISPLILFGSNGASIALDIKIDGVTNQTKTYHLFAEATSEVYETIDMHTLIDIPSGNHTISVAIRKYTIDAYNVSLYATGAQDSYMTAIVVQQ